MVATKTWSRLGESTWRVEVGLDDGEEPYAATVATAEFPARSLGLAKTYARRQLLACGPTPEPLYEGASQPYWWARVRRGTYVDDSFNDHEFGRVCDATWEPDRDPHDTWVEYSAWRTDGEVAWADPDFALTPVKDGAR